MTNDNVKNHGTVSSDHDIYIVCL